MNRPDRSGPPVAPISVADDAVDRLARPGAAGCRRERRTARALDRARQARPRLCRLAACLLALPVAALLGLPAQAGWFDSQTQSLVVLASGEFSLSLGQLSWLNPTTGEHGADSASLSQSVISPGDSLVITQAVTGDFRGDNLAVQLRLDWSSPPNGLTSSWHLTSADGDQVAPTSGDAALGEPLAVDGLVGTAPADWLVVITVTAPAGDPLYADPTSPAALTPRLALGSLVLDAEQVRRGTGFADDP